MSGPGARQAVIVMGVSGAGKSTVARLMTARLGWAHCEADELQPAMNVAKLRAGMPLTDLDRLPWLVAVRDRITSAQGPVVVSCSALRRSYRDLLRAPGLDVRFAHLSGDFELIWSRVGERAEPAMSATLLESQFAALEALQPDEPGAVIGVDVPADQVADQVINALGLTGAGGAKGARP